MGAITVIPATANGFASTSVEMVHIKKVAAYARVSTDYHEQLSSYEAQVDYYTKHIKSNEVYDLVQQEIKKRKKVKGYRPVEAAFQEKLFVKSVEVSMAARSGTPLANTVELFGSAILNLKMMRSAVHHIYIRIK